MPAKISFIVPAYNSEDFLDCCLDSISSQSLPDIEILCINNNSSDRTADIIEEHAQRDGRIRTLFLESRGVSIARNLGLSEAKGDYIAFVDSDDVISPTLAEQVYEKATSTDADIVLFSYTSILDDSDASIDVVLPHLPSEVCSPAELGRSIFTYSSPAVWNKLYKRSFLADQTMRFDEDLVVAEDVLFSYSAMAKCHRISSIPNTPLYGYRRNRLESLTNKTASVNPLFVFDAYKKLLDTKDLAIPREEFEQAILDKYLDEIDYAFRIAENEPLFRDFWIRFCEEWQPQLMGKSDLYLAKRSSIYKIYVESKSFEEMLFLRSRIALDRYDRLAIDNEMSAAHIQELIHEEERSRAYQISLEEQINILNAKLAKADAHLAKTIKAAESAKAAEKKAKGTVKALTKDITRLKNSNSYKIGRAITKPIRAIKRIKSRVSRKP